LTAMLVRLRFNVDFAPFAGFSAGDSGTAGAASSRARALVDRRGSVIIVVIDTCTYRAGFDREIVNDAVASCGTTRHASLAASSHLEKYPDLLLHPCRTLHHANQAIAPLPLEFRKFERGCTSSPPESHQRLAHKVRFVRHENGADLGGLTTKDREPERLEITARRN